MFRESLYLQEKGVENGSYHEYLKKSPWERVLYHCEKNESNFLCITTGIGDSKVLSGWRELRENGILDEIRKKYTGTLYIVHFDPLVDVAGDKFPRALFIRQGIHTSCPGALFLEQKFDSKTHVGMIMSKCQKRFLIFDFARAFNDEYSQYSAKQSTTNLQKVADNVVRFGYLGNYFDSENETHDFFKLLVERKLLYQIGNEGAEMQTLLSKVMEYCTDKQSFFKKSSMLEPIDLITQSKLLEYTLSALVSSTTDNSKKVLHNFLVIILLQYSWNIQDLRFNTRLIEILVKNIKPGFQFETLKFHKEYFNKLNEEKQNTLKLKYLQQILLKWKEGDFSLNGVTKVESLLVKILNEYKKGETESQKSARSTLEFGAINRGIINESIYCFLISLVQTLIRLDCIKEKLTNLQYNKIDVDFWNSLKQLVTVQEDSELLRQLQLFRMILDEKQKYTEQSDPIELLSDMINKFESLQEYFKAETKLVYAPLIDFATFFGGGGLTIQFPFLEITTNGEEIWNNNLITTEKKTELISQLKDSDWQYKFTQRDRYLSKNIEGRDENFPKVLIFNISYFEKDKFSIVGEKKKRKGNYITLTRDQISQLYTKTIPLTFEVHSSLSSLSETMVLKSVIVKYNNPDSGHYACSVRTEGKLWTYFDDNNTPRIHTVGDNFWQFEYLRLESCKNPRGFILPTYFIYESSSY